MRPTGFSVYASDTSFGHSWLHAEPTIRCNGLHRAFVTSSFVSATLNTAGWLGLTRQGLSLRKRRQALPGAPQICLYFIIGNYAVLLGYLFQFAWEIKYTVIFLR